MFLRPYLPFSLLFSRFLFSPWGNSEIPGKTMEEKTVRSVIIYIVIIESKYRLYLVKYLIFHYKKRRCVHILLDRRLNRKQINYLLPSSPLTLTKHRLPTAARHLLPFFMPKQPHDVLKYFPY